MRYCYKKNTIKQSGQTLIETVVAVFILVMGIVAALGLAIYALNASSNVSKQIVGIGLAREGIEAVKNMRDTNWLMLGESNDLENNCYDFSTGAYNASCYPCWLDSENWNDNDNDNGYEINPASDPDCPPSNDGEVGAASYRLGINEDEDDKIWDLDQVSNPTTSPRFGLDRNVNISNNNWEGFYETNNLMHGNSEFYREIILTTQNAAPFNYVEDGPGAKLLVQSRVWWVDKKCPRVSTFGAAKVTCRIELQSYLTNWKKW